MRTVFSILSVSAVLACSPADPPVPASGSEIVLPGTTLPVFGDGYPQTGDVCRRIGESAETVNFLDDTRDLVGCPETWAGREAYARSVGADEVLRQDGWVVYSIRRGN